MPQSIDQPMQLEEYLNAVASRFAEAPLTFGHGTDNAWDEAVALVLGFLDWADDAALLQTRLSAAVMNELEALVQQRITHLIPVPLLLGRCWFAGMEFEVAADVMIPRSPIAELVRTGFAPWLSHSPKRVLDVCCGGGCIGISCADEFPTAQVHLADLAPAAVQLAARNIERHQLQHRVQVFAGDLYAALPQAQAAQRYDLIVSNPPYVPSAETAVRPGEFLHEPAAAYDGGELGMDLVQRLLVGAADLLTPDGLLVIEVGQWRDTLESLWPEVPFIWPELQNGGEGVLVLEAAVVAEHTAHLSRPQ